VMNYLRAASTKNIGASVWGLSEMLFLSFSADGFDYGAIRQQFGSQIQNLQGPYYVLCFLHE
jgi:hypothetical protein